MFTCLLPTSLFLANQVQQNLDNLELIGLDTSIILQIQSFVLQLALYFPPEDHLIWLILNKAANTGEIEQPSEVEIGNSVDLHMAKAMKQRSIKNMKKEIAGDGHQTESKQSARIDLNDPVIGNDS